MQLTAYERDTIAEIAAWKARKPTVAEEGMALAMRPFQAPMRKLLEQRVVARVMEDGIEKLTDVATWTLPEARVYMRFASHSHGLDVRSSEQVAKLPLEQLDGVTGEVANRYKTVGGASGGLAGGAATVAPFVGGPAGVLAGVGAVAGDVIALMTLSLRAIVEHAYLYGFRFDSPEEHVYAVNVLNVGVAGDAGAKAAALYELNLAFAAVIAGEMTLDQVNKNLFHRTLYAVLQKAGIQTTRTRVAQLIPLVGIAAGGGLNRMQIKRVCEAARNSYRERFIARRHDRGVNEATIEPAHQI